MEEKSILLLRPYRAAIAVCIVHTCSLSVVKFAHALTQCVLTVGRRVEKEEVSDTQTVHLPVV